MNLEFGDTGKVVRGASEAEDVSVFVSPTTTFQGNSTSQVVISDATFTRNSASATDHAADLSIVSPGIPYVVVNESPGVVNLVGNSLSYISNGTANIRVNAKTGSRLISIPVYRESNGVTDTFLSYAAGSLAKSLYDSAEAALLGKTATETTKALLAISGSTYPRNSEYVLNQVDFTGVNAFVTIPALATPGAHSCTLLSPRHVAMAYHYMPLAATGPVTFIDRAGGEQTANIVGHVHIVKPYGSATPTEDSDLAIGILDQDITNCAYYKVPPANLTNLLPTLASVAFLPAIHTYIGTQPTGALSQKYGVNKKVQFNTLVAANKPTVKYSGASAPNKMVDLDAVVSGSLAPFSGQTWHSGSPSFLLLGTELILLGAMTNSAGQSSDMSQYLTEIQQAMNALSDNLTLPHQTLQVADFTSYTTW